MALFQLDPQSIVNRVHGAGDKAEAPTLAASVLRGVIGFTLVSVGGFAPWPIFERWFRSMGEMELYLACLAVFIGLSGVCLHRLIIGPGSLPRFYKLFSLAFTAYAVVWVALWVWLRGDAGVIGGLFGGAMAMGLVLAFAFDAGRATIKVVPALFVLNAIGYYLGGRIAGKLAIDHRALGMLLWGVCFGVGLGSGLGLAFYFCQERGAGIDEESGSADQRAAPFSRWAVARVWRMAFLESEQARLGPMGRVGLMGRMGTAYPNLKKW